MQYLRDILILPWQDAATLFWPIIVQGILVSCALGLLGCFLVVRGMSLLGDALSHAVLPGIAIGFFVSARFGAASLHSPWILIGATVMGLAAAVLVETVQKQSRVKEDASLGIVFTTLFALGVVLISRYGGQADLDAGCVLYGNIEYFVKIGDDALERIWPMAIILAFIVLGIIGFYRQLLVSTFDPGLAVSVGIAAWMVHYGLMTVLSLTIVASFEAVGAILAVALLILPGATARLWTQKLAHMLWFSVGFGFVATLLGYWLSHERVLNTSAGAAIVTAGFGLFMLSWLVAPRAGLISAWRVRRRMRRTIELENLIKAIAEIGEGATALKEKAESDARAEPPCAPHEARAGSNADSVSAPGPGPVAAGTSIAFAALSRELRWTDSQLAAVAERGVSRGWIHRHRDTLTLTPAGVARGARLEAAHLAWETYLHRQLGLPADHVHDAAEWIEHYLEDVDVTELRSIPGTTT